MVVGCVVWWRVSKASKVSWLPCSVNPHHVISLLSQQISVQQGLKVFQTITGLLSMAGVVSWDGASWLEGKVTSSHWSHRWALTSFDVISQILFIRIFLAKLMVYWHADMLLYRELGVSSLVWPHPSLVTPFSSSGPPSPFSSSYAVFHSLLVPWNAVRLILQSPCLYAVVQCLCVQNLLQKSTVCPSIRNLIGQWQSGCLELYVIVCGGHGWISSGPPLMGALYISTSWWLSSTTHAGSVWNTTYFWWAVYRN